MAFAPHTRLGIRAFVVCLETMKNGETKIQQMNCFDLLMVMMMMRKNHLDLLEGSSFVVVLLVWTAIFLLAAGCRAED